MALQKGRATGLTQFRRGSYLEIADYDHAWEVMFAYEGPDAAIRSVTLGPIPGEHSSMAVRQLLLDKQAASERSLKEALNRKPPASGDRCVLCRLAFNSEYEDGLGPRLIQRNRRNRFYCNKCDAFIRACPGQAMLDLPVLVVDVKNSRDIRNHPDVGLARYAALLAAFHRRVAAVIQLHLGFVLNTVGDAVIGVWPSGFVPDERRARDGWDRKNPARSSAKLAIEAAEYLAKDAKGAPFFDGSRLPYRGALDTTIMTIFAVSSRDKLPSLEFTQLDTVEIGVPLIDGEGSRLLDEAGVPGAGSESEFQTGPAATDIAGDAVEVASQLASHSDLAAGQMYITQHTDDIAGRPNSSYAYSDSLATGVRGRMV